MKFILSNPPHREADPVEVAAIFGITAAEARMKLNFPGPEVWFAGDDQGDLDRRLAEISDAGARAAVTSGQKISGLTHRLPLRNFAFRGDHLELHVGLPEPLDIPYAWSAHSVTCRPMLQENIVRLSVRQAARAANPNKTNRQQARTSLSQIRAPVDPSFIDIYFTDGVTVFRTTLWPGVTGYAGLEARKKLSQKQNTAEFVAMLGEHFGDFFDDRRLVNAPVPRITLLGKRTLRGHLELVSPELKDIDEYDLMSRLAFLAHHATG